MITRVARAYATVPAVLGSVLIVVAGLALEQQTVGVTRQPLPLVWPLAVLHVVTAQLLLPPVLGAFERVSLRGPLVRGVRAVLVLMLLTSGIVSYLSGPGHRDLLVFFLLVASVGFVAGAVGRADPWVWTLGLGMATVGLAFVTPLGGPISRTLVAIPVPAAGLLVVLAAGFYALKGWPPPSRDLPAANRTVGGTA